jgi:hypothetical protein
MMASLWVHAQDQNPAPLALAPQGFSDFLFRVPGQTGHPPEKSMRSRQAATMNLALFYLGKFKLNGR